MANVKKLCMPIFDVIILPENAQNKTNAQLQQNSIYDVQSGIILPLVTLLSVNLPWIYLLFSQLCLVVLLQFSMSL